MDKKTIHAFFDEMQKIADSRETPVFQSAPTSQQPSMNSTEYPGYLEGKDGSWRQKVRTKSTDVEVPSRPAREANNLFGLPLAVRRRGKREYDPNDSAARSADRSQSPIDGQGTTNTSGPSNNTFFGTSTGPGGV